MFNSSPGDTSEIKNTLTTFPELLGQNSTYSNLDKGPHPYPKGDKSNILNTHGSILEFVSRFSYKIATSFLGGICI